MSWDDAFAKRYEEWSASMTADVPFYVKLAREAGGPLVNLVMLVQPLNRNHSRARRFG